jgi:hypothetical protein
MKSIGEIKMKEYTKEQTLDYLDKNGALVITPELAKRLLIPFGLELDKKLIRTTKGYREFVFSGNENEPRVNVNSLAEYICNKLQVEPDKELVELSNQMLGVGSMCRLHTEACVKSIREMLDLIGG